MIGIPEGHKPPSSSTSLVVARRLTCFSGVSVVVALRAPDQIDAVVVQAPPGGDASGRGAMLQSTGVGKGVSRVEEETTCGEEESIKL